MRGGSENNRKPQTNFLESRSMKHFWWFLSYGMSAAEPLPMATRQVKQIMRHQLRKCADKTRLLLKKSSLEKQRSSEGGNDSPLINWNHVRGRRPLVHRTEISLENKGGGAERKGWRHVKVSQDHMASKSWPHTKQLPKIWRILFLLTEGPPGRSSINSVWRNARNAPSHAHTHTHSEV